MPRPNSWCVKYITLMSNRTFDAFFAVGVKILHCIRFIILLILYSLFDYTVTLFLKTLVLVKTFSQAYHYSKYRYIIFNFPWNGCFAGFCIMRKCISLVIFPFYHSTGTKWRIATITSPLFGSKSKHENKMLLSIDVFSKGEACSQSKPQLHEWQLWKTINREGVR